MNKQIKIIPRGDLVLVKPLADESRQNKKTGLYTPDSVEMEPKCRGTILSFGAKVTDLKKRQIAVYGKYAGEQIRFSDSLKEETDYILIPEGDILAIVE